jgi:hypothetical protein
VTVNVALENDPEPFVVIVDGDVVWGVPSNFIVIVEEAAKPFPDTVIVICVLFSPLVGLIVIEGTTVKVAEAVPVPSVALTM